jgi:hypothetical protein
MVGLVSTLAGRSCLGLHEQAALGGKIIYIAISMTCPASVPRGSVSSKTQQGDDQDQQQIALDFNEPRRGLTEFLEDIS